MQADMSSPDLRWRYGEALLESGDPEGARDAWRRAIVLAPDHAAAALRLADHCYRDHEPEEAVRWLKRICLRRPDDDGLRVAVLCLCLMHADTRRARAFAEDFLSAPARSNRLRGALFHLFRLFGDEGRARQAAGLGTGERPDGVEGRLLAAACADWAGDRQAAVQQYAAIAEMAPSGASLARKAVAQLRAGDETAAAATLASAVHLFLKQPEQLSDLASMLSWPEAAPLRQVVLSALEREALTEPAAAAAVALTAYRLGDWRRAADMLDGLPELPSGPAFAVIDRNLRAASAEADRLPGDAAGYAFGNDVPGLVQAGEPQGDAAGVLLVLGPDDDPGRGEMLVDALRESGVDPAVLQIGGVAGGGEMLPSTEDAELLSACMHGLPWMIAPGRMPAADAEGLPRAFGYLPPHMVAEIQFFISALKSGAAGTVHISGSATMLSAGLAALHAGARSVHLHLPGSTVRAGQARQGFFRRALARLLADGRCRALAGDDAELAAVREGFDPVREPRALRAGVDEKRVRRSSGGIHRLRAGETLGTVGDRPPPFLVSVLHDRYPPPDWLSRMAIDLSADGIRFVVWEWAVNGAAAHAGSAPPGLQVLRWPAQPAGYLAHADLGLLIGAADSMVLPLLSHAAMRVPVQPVGTTGIPAGSGGMTDLPSLPPVSPDDLADVLRSLAAHPPELAEIGEKSRLWVQSAGNLRRPARLLARLHERDRQRA